MRLVLLDSDRHLGATHRRVLRAIRPSWDVVLVEREDEAFAALAAARTDVFLAELGAPERITAATFEEVSVRWPSVIRIALSEFVARAVALRLERSVHRFLHEPCETGTLAMIVERCALVRESIDDPVIVEAVGGVDAIPRPPLSVLALEKVLADPTADVMSVAAVISRDAALTARLLRVANSAVFGLTRPVSRVDAAVNFLGLTLVRAITVADGVLRSFKVTPDVLDLDQWNTHAVRVAAAARDIMRDVRPHDRAMIDEAFLAGLLHDVGQVVLAGVAPSEWRWIEIRARELGAPICTVEADLERTPHAAVGAFLLTLWGLPTSVVEAVAFHHAPAALPRRSFDPTLAVHVADAVVTRTASVAPLLDAAAVAAAGISESQIAMWRSRYSAVEAVA